jgi:hypothetical protein
MRESSIMSSVSPSLQLPVRISAVRCIVEKEILDGFRQCCLSGVIKSFRYTGIPIHPADSMCVLSILVVDVI